MRNDPSQATHLTKLPLTWKLFLGVVIFLALVGTTLIAIRLIGSNALANSEAEIRAMGLVATYDEWLAANPINEAHREGGRASLTSLKALTDQTFSSPPQSIRDWSHTSSTVAPSALRSLLSASSAKMEGLLDKLRSATGQWHVRQEYGPDFDEARKITMQASYTQRFIAARNLADYVRLKALVSPDPTPHVTDLLLLAKRQEEGGAIMDNVFSYVIWGIAYETLTNCVVKQRLTPEVARVWLKDRPDVMKHFIEALQNERVFNGLMYHMNHPASQEEYADSIQSKHWGSGFHLWMVQPGDLASLAIESAQWEKDLRLGACPSFMAPSQVRSFRFPLASQEAMQKQTLFEMAVVNEARWRMYAAMLTLYLHHQHTPFQDLATSRSRIVPFLGATPQQIPLDMDMPSPGILRIAMDPRAPWPSAVRREHLRPDRMLSGTAAIKLAYDCEEHVAWPVTIFSPSPATRANAP